MPEKEKRNPQDDPQEGSDFFGQVASTMATVAHGPYSDQLPVAGKTVGEIRKKYADRFDIDPKSEPYINGKLAKENTTVGQGELLMFTRRAGEKG